MSADTAFERHRRELAMGVDIHALSLNDVSRVLVVAVFVAALLGSAALRSWVFELPLWLGFVREALLSTADIWHGWMRDIGFAELYPALREIFRSFRYL